VHILRTLESLFLLRRGVFLSSRGDLARDTRL
jgi:hypothetical protein